MNYDLRPQPAALPPPSMPSTLDLGDVELRMRRAQENHLGGPFNLLGDPPLPTSLAGYLINNQGDPYASSPYGANVCDFEREVVAWLIDRKSVV